jgi:ADP-heptose:LPS heptosyltransferase
MFNSIKQFVKKAYLVCRKAILSLLAYAFVRKKLVPIINNPVTFLIIAPPRIGDAALTLPVFVALKNSFPKSQLQVVANKYVGEIFSLVKEIDQIIPFTKNLFAQIYNLRGIVKRPNYDISVDLNFDYHLSPAILAGLTAKYSVGYEYAGRGFLLNKGLSIVESSKHASDIFFQPILDILPSAEKVKPQLDVPHEVVSKIQGMLVKVDIINEDKVVLIHPGAYHPTQIWIPEYFTEIADKIIGTGKVKLLFVGDSGEKALIDNIFSLMKKRPAGTFMNIDIKTLVGLIHRADLMICNNSGPLHIAVAVNTPTISLMGPTIRERWMPIGEIHKVLRIDELSCIGCNLGYCKIKTHDCMRLIKPSIVFEAIKDHFRAI